MAGPESQAVSPGQVGNMAVLIGILFLADRFPNALDGLASPQETDQNLKGGMTWDSLDACCAWEDWWTRDGGLFVLTNMNGAWEK
jgi:hypothetical protein